MRISLFLLGTLLFLCLWSACKVSDYASDSGPVSHELWDSLVREHVTDAGQVDYKGFIKDSVKLNKYLALLSKNHPNDKNWSKDEQLAYWINAYNAFRGHHQVSVYFRHIALVCGVGLGEPKLNTFAHNVFVKAVLYGSLNDNALLT